MKKNVILHHVCILTIYLFLRLTKSVALDCEMVGVGPGGVESALARISIVNHFGKCVYDKFVKPGDEVTDYRTQFSGIRPHNLKNGKFIQAYPGIIGF